MILGYQNLRMVVMSTTLDVARLQEYFMKHCSVLEGIVL